jgi:hypothetical protein
MCLYDLLYTISSMKNVKNKMACTYDYNTQKSPFLMHVLFSEVNEPALIPTFCGKASCITWSKLLFRCLLTVLWQDVTETVV